MAYSATNLTQLAHGAGFKLWVYKSADAIATVNTDNYFASAAPMLSVRDLMIVVDTNTPTTNFVTVLSCDGVSAVDVSDGTAVAETDGD